MWYESEGGVASCLGTFRVSSFVKSVREKTQSFLGIGTDDKSIIG